MILESVVFSFHIVFQANRKDLWIEDGQKRGGASSSIVCDESSLNPIVNPLDISTSTSIYAILRIVIIAWKY